MAAPVYATESANITGAGTSATLSKPTSLASGDLVIAIFAVDGNPGVTWGAGGGGQAAWTELAEVNDNGEVTLAVAYKWVNATDISEPHLGTINFGASEDYVGKVVRITGAHASIAPEIATVTTGGAMSAASNSPSRTATWGADDILWLAGWASDNQGSQADVDVSDFTWPTGYTGRFAESSSSSAASRVAVGWASRAVTGDDGTEDPASMNLLQTNEVVSFTIAIPSTSASTGPVAKSASDTLAASITDAVGPFLLMFSASDALDPTLTEGQLSLVSLGSSDALALSIAEAQASLLSLVGSDDLNVSIAESALAAITVSALDTLAVALAESGSVLDISIVVKAASDTLAMAITETASSGVFIAASDSLSLSLLEGYTMMLMLTVADTLGVGVSELASAIGTVTSTDAMDVTFAELATPAVLVGVADTLGISISEAAALAASVLTVNAAQGFVRDMATASAEVSDRPANSAPTQEAALTAEVDVT